jgi:hypothetical protein
MPSGSAAFRCRFVLTEFHGPSFPDDFPVPIKFAVLRTPADRWPYPCSQPRERHWHRTERDPGRPYRLRGAETLIDDFFDEVERVLGERGIGMTVAEVEDVGKSE